MRRDQRRLRAVPTSLLTVALLVGAVVGPGPLPIVAAAGPSVTDYDAGEVIIEQPDMGPQTRFAEMPVRLQGIVAVPEGDGPFPVLLFLHGSYRFCTAPLVDGEVDPYPCPPDADLRQYEGFAELALAWADRGYLTVVPDLAAEYNNGFGFAPFGLRASRIADAHLDALTDASGPHGDVATKADPERTVIVGHSRGGPLAVRYITDPDARRSPLGLVLLTPAFMAPDAVIPDTMPTMLVAAGCDGDVGLDGPSAYRREQLPWLRPAPTLYHLIAGGTHNAFSTRLDPDLAAACDPDQAILPEQQRATVARLVPDFLDLALGFSD